MRQKTLAFTNFKYSYATHKTDQKKEVVKKRFAKH